MKKIKVGEEVVRSKGDYVVGRIGLVVALDIEKSRAQVDWVGETKTWVSFDALEPTSVPYRIIPFQEIKVRNKVKRTWPKYERLHQPAL